MSEAFVVKLTATLLIYCVVIYTFSVMRTSKDITAQLNLNYLLKGFDIQKSTPVSSNWERNLLQSRNVQIIYNDTILVTPYQSFYVLIANHTSPIVTEVVGCIASAYGREMSSSIYVNTRKISAHVERKLNINIANFIASIVQRKQRVDLENVKKTAATQLIVEYILKHIIFEETYNPSMGSNCNIYLTPRNGDKLNSNNELDILYDGNPVLKSLNWELYLERVLSIPKSSAPPPIVSVSDSTFVEPFQSTRCSPTALVTPAHAPQLLETSGGGESAFSNGVSAVEGSKVGANVADRSECEEDTSVNRKRHCAKNKLSATNPLLDFATGLFDFIRINKKKNLDSSGPRRGSLDSCVSKDSEEVANFDQFNNDSEKSTTALFTKLLATWSSKQYTGPINSNSNSVNSSNSRNSYSQLSYSKINNDTNENDSNIKRELSLKHPPSSPPSTASSATVVTAMEESPASVIKRWTPQTSLYDHHNRPKQNINVSRPFTTSPSKVIPFDDDDDSDSDTTAAEESKADEEGTHEEEPGLIVESVY